MTRQWLLRFEAADFDNTVFDMPVVPAVRGASLAYLYSPKTVDGALKRCDPNARAIYKGASQGAWRFEAEAAQAAKAERSVVGALSEKDGGAGPHRSLGRVTRHLAYVTALVEGSDAAALAKAETICNLRKLQGEGFALPEFAAGAKGYDETGDRARPAVASIGREQVSAAHCDRRKFGRKQRQKFYEDFTGLRPDRDFTDDFEALVSDPPRPGGKALPPSLRNKVAVFFADGNRLNRHRRKAGGLDGLNRFSESLKRDQKALLVSIVAWLQNGADERNAEAYAVGADGQLRFETLMWGGDELLFVMPSWLGLEFAENFFEWTKEWRTPWGDPITFSAGMAICDRKTPIRQSREVAQDLAELGKDMQPAGNQGGDMQGGTRSLLQIEVFESLSLPEGRLDDYRERLYRPPEGGVGLLHRQLAIPGEALADLTDRLAQLKAGGGVPRSQLYRMLQIAVEGAAGRLRGKEADETLRDAWAVYRRRAGEGAAPVLAALDVLNHRQDLRLDETPPPAFALSLGAIAMLWDYVRPLGAERAP